MANSRRKPRRANSNAKSNCTRDGKGTTNNGRKENFREKSSEYGDAKEMRKGDYAGNDPKWYNKFPELIESSTRLSWQTSLGGKRITSFSDYDPILPVVDKAVSIDAGICTLKFIPTFGVGVTLSDPVNKAALEMYSQLRYNKSGSVQYDPSDCMIYMIAVDSVFTYIAWLERIYGIMNLASPVNRYIPFSLLSTDGVDYDNVYQYRADFHYNILSLISQMAKYNVPVGYTVFNRHWQMASYVYKDEDIDRASLYKFTPTRFWYYDETTGTMESTDLATYYNHAAPFTWVEHEERRKANQWATEFLRGFLQCVSRWC